ncbi:MAG: anhydro-N-acetylmuramic acid kinase [Ruthenibacterium lactatiformans]
MRTCPDAGYFPAGHAVHRDALQPSASGRVWNGLPSAPRAADRGRRKHEPCCWPIYADCLPGLPVLTNEQLGLDSSAKEAVAFAVLANEALYGCANNAPGATGAAHGVVMGKISL